MKRIGVFLLFFFIVQSVRADLMCDDAGVDYYAFYEPNTYTCEAGYFLPANTDGCVACPSGYNCPGGTFKANSDKFQGITISEVSTSLDNMCADNFPADLFLVYEPNVIDLTYDNGDGTTVESSCVYDGAVAIPPQPSRVGYIFTGWRVKENNN